MGFTPQQVNAMSMWQFFAAMNGYVAANSPRDAGKLTEAEADDLFDWIERGMGRGVRSTMTYWIDGDRLVPWRRVQFDVN